MLKLSLTLIIFGFSLAHARVEFEELIKNDINKQNELAIEAQQFAKIETYTKDENKPYYIKREVSAGKEKDFKVSLKRKTKKKNPTNQRSIASKENRVPKKIKNKTKKQQKKN